MRQAAQDTKRAEAALSRAAERPPQEPRCWPRPVASKPGYLKTQAEGSGGQYGSKQLHVAPHDQLSVAPVATLGAIVLGRQGDYLGAKQNMKNPSHLSRLGNKVSLGAEYDNLGDILLYLGDTAQAQRVTATLTTYQT